MYIAYICASAKVLKSYQHVLHISSNIHVTPQPRFESAAAWPGDGGSAPPDPSKDNFGYNKLFADQNRT